MTHLPAARAIAAKGAPVLATADSLAVHHALAAAGVARAILPCFLGDADPGLVREDDVPEAEQDLWLALRTDLMGSARVRAVVDFLTEAATASAGALSGKVGRVSHEPEQPGLWARL